MADALSLLPFLNAYTFGFCEKQGFTRGQSWKWSLEELVRTTHCNALILPVCAWQDHTYSTSMTSSGPDVMDEEDVRRVCAHARALGLRILLKAMVNCRDGYWRAFIRFFEPSVPTEPCWEDWFASWEDHVCRVAAMAEENAAALFCVGCEMVCTDHREADWRHLIASVRNLYHGPITYNCDKFQEDHIAWWDAVDVISSSGYYPIDQLHTHFTRIEKTARAFSKPFMFMECGCPSRLGSEMRPNDWRYGTGTDPATQAAWYKAFLDALHAFPFIRGTGWWDWSATRLYPEAVGCDSNGYCTYGKPANDLLRSFSDSIAGEMFLASL